MSSSFTNMLYSTCSEMVMTIINSYYILSLLMIISLLVSMSSFSY